MAGVYFYFYEEVRRNAAHLRRQPRYTCLSLWYGQLLLHKRMYICNYTHNTYEANMIVHPDTVFCYEYIYIYIYIYVEFRADYDAGIRIML